MGKKRIIHAKDVVEIGFLIQKRFGNFPVPLRGAIASLGEAVDRPYYCSGRQIKFRVKGIEQILNDGIELDLRSGWTRVDCSERGNWSFVYAGNRGFLDYVAESLGDEQRKLLKPVILAYDSSLLTQLPENSPNRYNVRLPEQPEDRARSILAVYINHTEETEDWSKSAF
ncbi:hypothetical protein HY501_00490 [Candidatus Woesearchaeota archaeon]|nr:hypothetical protein [Candidatus Woesearchaeota archaeon]